MSKINFNKVRPIRLFIITLYVGGLCACASNRIISPDVLAEMAWRQHFILESIYYLGTVNEYHHFSVHDFGKKDKCYRVSSSALNVPSSMVRELRRKDDPIEIYIDRNTSLNQWNVVQWSKLYREPFIWSKVSRDANNRRE